MKISLITLCVIIIICVALLILNSCSPKLRTTNTTDILFTPCGSAPNCIASDGSGYAETMKPVPYVDALPVMIKKLDTALTATADERGEKLHLSYEDSTTRHYVFASKYVGFKDDLLFVFDDSQKLMHYRSSSRVGYADFNYNKDRMDMIISYLQK